MRNGGCSGLPSHSEDENRDLQQELERPQPHSQAEGMGRLHGYSKGNR